MKTQKTERGTLILDLHLRFLELSPLSFHRVPLLSYIGSFYDNYFFSVKIFTKLSRRFGTLSWSKNIFWDVCNVNYIRSIPCYRVYRYNSQYNKVFLAHSVQFFHNIAQMFLEPILLECVHFVLPFLAQHSGFKSILGNIHSICSYLRDGVKPALVCQCTYFRECWSPLSSFVPPACGFWYFSHNFLLIKNTFDNFRKVQKFSRPIFGNRSAAFLDFLGNFGDFLPPLFDVGADFNILCFFLRNFVHRRAKKQTHVGVCKVSMSWGGTKPLATHFGVQLRPLLLSSDTFISRKIPYSPENTLKRTDHEIVHNVMLYWVQSI